MKRLHLIITIALISVYSAFGYTILEDFNDFLIDENQLTIRLDRAGVLAGSENVRFMIGVEGETAGVLLDNLDNGVKGGINIFKPRAIAGIGYKNDKLWNWLWLSIYVFYGNLAGSYSNNHGYRFGRKF